MTTTDDWDAVAEASRETLAPEVRSALLAHLTRMDRFYKGDRLRVGADLKPIGEGCDRATWYRLNGVPADQPQLARRLRYERGRAAQRIFVDALREAGREVEDEVAVRALRPTAWAWDSGHGDVLDVQARHLYEVKAPGIDAWRRARGLPVKLVREAYRFQLSWYFHELQREGRVDTASWIFFDLEGEFDPVEIDLQGGLLVPVSEIVAIEEAKNRLMWATEAPLRPANTVEVLKILKGGRKTKRNPIPERQVFAVVRRFWGCQFCDFLDACQPGPEEVPISLADTDPIRVAAVVEAEREWAAEDAEKKARKVDAEASTGENGPTEAPPSRSPQNPPDNPVPPATEHPPTAGPPPSPEAPAAILYSGLATEPPPASPGDEPKAWKDDRTKADKRDAASDLAASMKEIDDRAARGEPTFPIHVEGDEWKSDAPAGW